MYVNLNVNIKETQWYQYWSTNHIFINFSEKFINKILNIKVMFNKTLIKNLRINYLIFNSITSRFKLNFLFSKGHC